MDQSGDLVSTPFSVKDILSMSAVESEFSSYNAGSCVKSEFGYDEVYPNSWDCGFGGGGYDHYGCNFYGNPGESLGRAGETSFVGKSSGCEGGFSVSSHVQQLTSFCAPYEQRKVDSPSEFKQNTPFCTHRNYRMFNIPT